ncbi:MAG: porin, partial [Cyanobacteria bacterium P01_D01_bin.14]
LEGDRLGLGYGQQLSNGDLRSGRIPDVWEIFYDASVYENVRAGISLQSREEFSDTFLGIRVRADW